ncbi:MAG: acyl carrier protein [Nitrospinae bacterium CG11_big_fil_rev_8_21_14_0_20_56_8]|nr:MAG: acyl carrier protein [Nitrospinae bacterium CG11_big_fil_rev_8_21_14_0_20_56_8]
MTRDEVRGAILDILSEIAPDENIESIDDNRKLRDQMDLDSMDFLDIVMELRKRFNIEVPEKDYEHLATMSGCIAYLQPLMLKKQVAN